MKPNDKYVGGLFLDGLDIHLWKADGKHPKPPVTVPLTDSNGKPRLFYKLETATKLYDFMAVAEHINMEPESKYAYRFVMHGKNVYVWKADNDYFGQHVTVASTDNKDRPRYFETIRDAITLYHAIAAAKRAGKKIKFGKPPKKE
ncbi:MAG: hypothetical protein ABIG30_00155 [Candidatus Aenigmatarchaeota archaeon]